MKIWLSIFGALFGLVIASLFVVSWGLAPLRTSSLPTWLYPAGLSAGASISLVCVMWYWRMRDASLEGRAANVERWLLTLLDFADMVGEWEVREVAIPWTEYDVWRAIHYGGQPPTDVTTFKGMRVLRAAPPKAATQIIQPAQAA